MGDIFTCDVLIVGGGIAGLTAGAYLAKDGKDVLLCEKENKLGGLVTSFKHNKFVFDTGLRSIENSGIVTPMLKQLGIEIDFIKSLVSVGIGQDVVHTTTKESLTEYQELLNKHFPDNTQDIENIIQEIKKIMGYMDILYGIDNPLFMDLKENPKFIIKTILPWVFKYMLTMPKINRLNGPVDEYLLKFTSNQALIDIIAQHFFQKTPTFFALSYFSLYLDYRYPKGGTGKLPAAMETFYQNHNGRVKKETKITAIDPANNTAVDAEGNRYKYKKMLWAADLKTLYRIINTDSITNKKTLRKIKSKQKSLEGKVGGDSIFTVYLSLNINKTYFSEKAKPHFFYTPSLTGLSHAPLEDIKSNNSDNPNGFTDNKADITAWLKRYFELTTYEISCPAQRDENLAPEGKCGLIVSSLFEYQLTKHIENMGWYDEFKKLSAEYIIDVLDSSIYPGLKAGIIDYFTSTPVSIENKSGNSEGGITGWAFTNESIPAVNKLIKVASSVLTPIPHVYQAGQWTYSPSGFPISILTGKLAADAITKR